MKLIDSRAHFIMFAAALAQISGNDEMKQLQKQLDQGTLGLADSTVYSARPCGLTTNIRLFEPQDQMQIGIRNLSNGKLDKGRFLLVTGITILAAQHNAEVTNAVLVSKEFGSIVAVPTLTNGELTISVRSKRIIQELPMQNFVRENNIQGPIGYFELENPFMWCEEDPLEAEIVLGAATPANSAVKIIFHGTGTVSA